MKISKDKTNVVPNICGDICLQGILRKHFSEVDTRALLNSARLVHKKLFDIEIEKHGKQILNPYTFYFPEYQFEIKEHGYTLTIITPFGVIQSLDVHRRIKQSTIENQLS